MTACESSIRFTDDAVYHAMPLPPIVGKAALEPWVRSFEPSHLVELEIHHQAVTGDVVMNERTDRITIEGNRGDAVDLRRVRGGRRPDQAWREYFDLAGLQAALRSAAQRRRTRGRRRHRGG